MNIYQQNKIEGKHHQNCNALFYPTNKKFGAQMGRPNVGAVENTTTKELWTLRTRRIILSEGYDKEGVYWGTVQNSILYAAYTKNLEYVRWFRINFAKPFQIDYNALVDEIHNRYFSEFKYMSESDLGNKVKYEVECYHNGVIYYTEFILRLTYMIRVDIAIIQELVDKHRKTEF